MGIFNYVSYSMYNIKCQSVLILQLAYKKIMNFIIFFQKGNDATYVTTEINQTETLENNWPIEQ